MLFLINVNDIIHSNDACHLMMYKVVGIDKLKSYYLWNTDTLAVKCVSGKEILLGVDCGVKIESLSSGNNVVHWLPILDFLYSAFSVDSKLECLGGGIVFDRSNTVYLHGKVFKIMYSIYGADTSVYWGEEELCTYRFTSGSIGRSGFSHIYSINEYYVLRYIIYRYADDGSSGMVWTTFVCTKDGNVVGVVCDNRYEVLYRIKPKDVAFMSKFLTLWEEKY